MPESRPGRELRRLVRDRARACCEYCRSQEAFSPQPFALEHILPRSKGGPTSEDNLCWSCQGCNGHKHVKTEGIDPVGLGPAPLFHPRAQSWDDHFAWDASFTRLLGLTPTGRATIDTLSLNRDNLVNLRRVLHVMGEHPPAS